MKYQLLNGVEANVESNLVPASNRSFRYGDGFFESMRVSNGSLLFADLHWKRLVHACKVLRINIPQEFTVAVFSKEANRLASMNNEPNSRIRFQGFRSGSGRYTPETSVLEWIMESEELEKAEFQLNKKGLTVGVCRSHAINPLPQSGFKSSNAVPYVLGGIHASENNWDDCFMLDSEGFIAEATGSNVFLVQQNRIITPNLQNGGVPGVMRAVLLHEATKLGFEVVQQLVREDDLIEADECFLSTATRGITWVSAFQKKRYFKKVASKLVDHLNWKYVNG